MDAGRVIELCFLGATAAGTVGLWFESRRAKREVKRLKVQIDVMQQQITNNINSVMTLGTLLGGGGGGGGGQHGGTGGGGGGGFGQRGGDGGSINIGGDQTPLKKGRGRDD
jgi:hypothetical protein